jgi:SAM-dependent methyltransferase
MTPVMELKFMQCAFADLPVMLADERFDLIFSNFSGLNCVSPNDLESLGLQFNQLLNPGGHIAVVIFGKYNWWETIYYLLKGKPAIAFRRWRKKASVAVLKEESVQPVYYYSASRFCRLLHHFKRIERRPVGLFVPPSYLESFMQKHPGLFRWLEKLEKRRGMMPAFSQLADHQYLLLKKV